MEELKTSAAARKASTRYQRQHPSMVCRADYHTVERVKKYAAEHGESVQGLILRLLLAEMENNP